MPLYHLLLDAAAFHDRIRPALAAAWLRRSFEPCRPLCAALLPAARAFAARYHLGPDEPLLAGVARGLPFDRDFWRHLVGEALWYSAAEIPEFESAPDSLCCLLAPQRYLERTMARERFAPIEQAHYGARDLVFGGAYYRPDQAGYNDTPDVQRLADYLDGLDPQAWTVTGLTLLEGVESEEDRAEELEFVRDWFPALRELYRRAREQRQMVVCEIL
jgi:hypothetical protein